MRTNKTLRIASILLIAVLMTSCIIGSTMAKYTSTTGEKTSSARVAKWEINIQDGETPAALDTFTIDNLFTYTDTGVATVENEKLIAPGTTNTFKLPQIINNSEVAAKYTVTITVTKDDSLPLTFSSSNNLTASNDGKTYTMTGELAPGGKTSETQDTITWTWAFETKADDSTTTVGDAADTTLGTAETLSEVKVVATIAVEQLDTYTAPVTP